MTVSVAGTARIDRAFTRAREEKRVAVAVFLTVGYPEPSETAGLLRAALDGGADVLELGVPFSDPLADGATVQRASETALRAGIRLADCIAEARTLVAERDATVLLMGYTNPFLAYGVERFARDAREAGISGVIVPDLPAEESAELDDVLVPSGLVRIDLYAPTTPDARLDRLLPRGRGFVYCVSLTGVTGARHALPADVASFVARVRARTPLPIVVGFGIAAPSHVSGLVGIADGVAVGSAAIDAIAGATPTDRARALRDFVRSLVTAGRAVKGER